MILFTILLCFRLGSAFPRYFDNMPLKEVAMVFSHDAATGYMKPKGFADAKIKALAPWVKTQDQTFSQQADMGVRAWDVRPHREMKDGKYQMVWHHGDVVIRDITFEQGLDELIEWLSKHPTEIFVMNWFSCTGDDCEKEEIKKLAAKGIPRVDDCSIFDTITVGEARKRWALKTGGTMISTDNCVKDNYAKAEKVTCHYMSKQIGHLGPRSCYEVGFDSSWNQPAKKFIAMMDDVVNTDHLEQNGLTRVQAHWNYDTQSIVYGVLRKLFLSKPSSVEDATKRSKINHELVDRMDKWEDNVKMVGIDFVSDNGDQLYNRLMKINYRRAKMWECNVQLFSEPGFKGKSVQLPLGVHTDKNSAKGVGYRLGFNFRGNSKVKSLKVSEGCRAVLIDGSSTNEFGGGRHDNVAMTASRINVSKESHNCKVTLYSEDKFHGDTLTREFGTHQPIAFKSLKVTSSRDGCKATMLNASKKPIKVLTEGEYTLDQLKKLIGEPAGVKFITLSPRAPVEYTMINVAQTCKDLGLDVVDTQAECRWAAEAMKIKGSHGSIQHHKTAGRPAGCILYDYMNQGNPKLEFNSNLDSTWTGNWMDLYQVCRRTPTVSRHNVSATCKSRGLAPITSIDHCEWAMGQIGLNKGQRSIQGVVPKVTVIHELATRPAGCFEYMAYVHENGGFSNMEFNKLLTSSWTDPNSKDMYQICQDVPTSVKATSAVLKRNHECLPNSGSHEKNLGTFSTLEQCREACLKEAKCNYFIYGKKDGPSGNKAGQCWWEFDGTCDAKHPKFESDSYDVHRVIRATRCKYPGKYAPGYPLNDRTKRSLDQSMLACKSNSDCKAVTCAKDGNCTLRKEGNPAQLQDSPSGETTYKECTVPPKMVAFHSENSRRLDVASELPAPLEDSELPAPM